MAAGTVASIAGTAVTANEANQNNTNIAEARNRVLRETQARNKIASDESRSLFAKRIADMAPENTQPQLATEQGQRTDTIQSNIDEAPAIEALPEAAAAPKVVQTALGKRLAEAAEKATARSAAMGKLAGYGDFMQGQAISDEEAGRGIDTQANLIRGNMGILPALQDYAEISAYKPSSGLGEILSTLGSVAGMAAGSGAFKKPGAPGSGSYLLPNMKLKGPGGTLGGGV